MASQQNKILNFNNRVWWIVFKPSHDPIVNKITKKGFGHCFALTRMNNLVLVIDPMMGIVNHVITDAELGDMLAEYKINGDTVLFLNHAPEPSSLINRGLIVTCATYLAYSLGIPFGGLTPYQLYKKILKMGGEIL